MGKAHGGRTWRGWIGVVCVLVGCLPDLDNPPGDHPWPPVIDPGSPGNYLTQNVFPRSGRSCGAECDGAEVSAVRFVALADGVLVRSGPGGLEVLDSREPMPRPVQHLWGYGELLGTFGTRGVIARPRWPASQSDYEPTGLHLRALEVSVLEAQEVRGDGKPSVGGWWQEAEEWSSEGIVYSRPPGEEGGDAAESWWVNVERVGPEGVFQPSWFKVDQRALVAWFISRDLLLVLMETERVTGLDECQLGEGVFCPVGSFVFGLLDTRPGGRMRLLPGTGSAEASYGEAVLSGEVLYVVGSAYTDDVAHLTVQAARLDDLGSLDGLDLDLRAAWHEGVFALPGGQLAVVTAPESELHVLGVVAGALGERSRFVLPPNTVPLGQVAGQTRMVAATEDDVLLLAPLAQNAREVVVARVAVPPRGALGERATLVVDADGQGASVWVPREAVVDSGFQAASVTQVRWEGDALEVAGTVALPDAATGVVGLDAERVIITTELDWLVFDTAGLEELGRRELVRDRDRKACFEVRGHGVRHVGTERRTWRDGVWAHAPNRLEVLAPGADLDVGEPVRTVELPADALVLKDGDRLVAWGRDVANRAVIEVWDLAEPTAPQRVGVLTDEALEGVPPIEEFGRWPVRLAMREGVIVAVDEPVHDPQRVFVVDTRASGGPTLVALAMPRDEVVDGVFSDEAGLRLSVFRPLPDDRSQGRFYLVQLDVGDPASPRWGSEVNVPGAVLATQGAELLTDQQPLDARGKVAGRALHHVTLDAGVAHITHSLAESWFEGPAGCPELWGTFAPNGELIAQSFISDHGASTSTLRLPLDRPWDTSVRSVGGPFNPRAMAGPWLLADVGVNQAALELGVDDEAPRHFLSGHVGRVEPVEGGWAVVGSDGVISFLPAP